MALPSPSRRSLLKALAGAAALGPWVGCAPSRAAITGGLVGAAAERGHRLRDGPPAPATRFEAHDLVIVGAGVAGLSAAWRLAKAGVATPPILELEDVLGGNARWGQAEVCPYPWGAHYLPAPPPEAHLTRMLLRELGVIVGEDTRGRPIFDERATCFHPEERIFYRGEWYPGLYLSAGASEEDRRQWRAFEAEMTTLRHTRGRDGRRVFTIPLDLSSRDAEWIALDALPFSTWLDQRGYTSPRLRWMATYATRDDYGALPHQISAWAGLHYFASRVLHADPTHDVEPPTLTWPAGNGWLVERLAAPHTHAVRTGRLAFHAEARDEGVALSVLDLATGAVEGLLARQLLWCGSLVGARRALPPVSALLHQAELAWGPWMVANLHVTERPTGRGADPAWDNVLYDGMGVGYVTATHQQADYRGPAVLTYYLPLCDDDDRAARQRLLDTPWEGWVKQVLADLGPAHPDLPDLVTHLDVLRWGHAMLRPRPGWLWGGLRERLHNPAPGLHLAHTDLALPLFEEAQAAGVRAAEAALRGLGHSVDPL